MPTYEYQCKKCGFEFEREQRITEDAIKTCPECKSRKAKRLLSAPNFILKGGGWYADGYGSSGKKSPEDGSSSDKSSSDDTSTKKDDSKSKTKAKDSSSSSSSEKKSAGKSSKSKAG